MGNPDASSSPVRTVLALILSTPVLLTPVTLAGLGGWLLASGTSAWLGIVCLGAALALLWRPRRRRDDSASTIELSSAPVTSALLDAVAAAVDATTPRRIEVTRGFGAEAYRRGTGWTIAVGAPLWLGLGPAERVSLLAQALAPHGNAPGWSEQYVGAALRTLDRLISALSPDAPGDPASVYDPVIIASNIGSAGHTIAGRAQNRLGTDIVTVLLWPIRTLAALYRRLLAASAEQMTRQHEHRVDAAVSAVAGAPALAQLHRELANAEAIATIAQRAANTGGDMQLTVRQRTVRLVEAAEAVPDAGTVHVSPAHWEAIDAEWSEAVTAQFERLRRDYR